LFYFLLPALKITKKKQLIYCITLAEDLKAENVRTDQIFFIDMVTKYVGTPKEEAPNCIFIDSPQDLTDMAIVMQQAADHFKGKCPLIILDSISTLLIYNDIKVISKFSHFFTEKIKLWKAKGVVFSVQKETDEKLMELLTQFCDERVDL